MGKLMKNALINPYQLRNYHVNFQDNLTSCRTIRIITDDGDFSMDLHIKGNIVYFNSNTPTHKELEYCPHIHFISGNTWYPMGVHFSSTSH